MTNEPQAPDPTQLPPSNSLPSLLQILDLEQVGEDRYRGVSQQTAWGRVYGGQVLAQAMVAAGRTVGEDRPMHSLHGYFILGGDPTVPIGYDVERVRDGGSFATRRVRALQNGMPIFEMLSSFHKVESGFCHASAMPETPPPEEVLAARELFSQPEARIPATMRAYYQRERPFELRPVDQARYFGGANLPPMQRFWLKARDRLPDEQSLHSAMLAFASDFAMIDTALIPHGKLMFDPRMQLASLDHALWIHSAFRADDWLLYVLESPAAGGGRAFARGSFYTRNGMLVASVAQEGLARERSTAFVLK